MTGGIKAIWRAWCLFYRWLKSDSAVGPADTTLKRTSTRTTASSRAKNFGMKWNETALEAVCKFLKTWWPGKVLDGITHLRYPSLESS